ncbi:MAG: ribonuclease P protein component [Cyanobacteriota bacterium]|nr:ribonuclease P protein component [Cyanobacteriota bacterium]
MALPQRHRLKGRRVFDRLYQRGRRLHGPLLTLRWLVADPALLPPPLNHQSPSAWRCGLVISAKVSKRAVQRNRLRRRLQAQLLLHPPVAPAPLWLLISLKPGCAEADPGLLLGECNDLLRQAGLLP